MNKRGNITTNAIFVLMLCICAGCSARQDDLEHPAQIEIYSAENNELIRVIDDEETLYQYNQCAYDDSDSGQHQEELEQSLEGIKEEYNLISYKYPVSHFNGHELEKNITITTYENSNIIKMTVDEDSVKGASIPEEFLIFYYEVSDKDMEFYRSLAKE